MRRVRAVENRTSVLCDSYHLVSENAPVVSQVSYQVVSENVSRSGINDRVSNPNVRVLNISDRNACRL